jgi:chromosome segregation ATPase
MTELQLQFWQTIIAAIGPLLTAGMMYLVWREVRTKERAVAVEAGAAAMSSAKDEFDMMDLLQKRQQATIEEQRAAIAQVRTDHFNTQRDNAVAIETIKADFQRQLKERDELRKAEHEAMQAELNQLRSELVKSQDRIRDLEAALKTANSKIDSLTRELEAERSRNAALMARIAELEQRADSEPKAEAANNEPKTD